MTTRTRTTNHPVLACFMIIAGIVGLIAAFELTLERLALLKNPNEGAGCDFSIVIQCSANIESPQGSIFGFPNPLFGLIAWMAPIVVGVAMLAGARFARWFWALYNLGVLAAMVLVVWLISQSIFVLGTLCIWCMITWSVTIPLFLAVTLHNFAEGNIPAPKGVRRVADTLRGWIVVITFACYVIVAVVAQLRLDWIKYIF